MAISKRTLSKWRRQALQSFDEIVYEQTAKNLAKVCKDYEKRILHMTQILLDQELLKGSKR